MSISNILAKSAGVIGLGLVAYDAHKYAQYNAVAVEKDHKAHSLSSRFIDDMKLDSPSTVRAGVKKKMFDYAADEEFSGFFVSTKGYLKGILTSLVSNVIPLGLSLGAVLTKGIVSKCFAGGLAAYGAVFILQEAFGIGKAKH